MARRPDPDTRNRLLAAARTAFAEVGVEAARIEDIARAAGVSKGSFYLHFPSKEAAFAELVASFFAVMTELAADRHEATQELRARIGNPTPEDWRGATPCLRAWGELDHAHTVKALKTMWRHRDVLRCVLEHASGERAHLVDRFIALTRDNLTAQLRDAMAACGLRNDLDQDIVSELIIGMYLQLGRRMVRATTRPDFDAWARTVDALTIEGLAPRSPTPSAFVAPARRPSLSTDADPLVSQVAK